MKPAIPVFRTFVPESARKRAAATIARGWLGYGPECRELERRFAGIRGGFALAAGSCTSALHLAAQLLRRRTPRRDVIVPAITFISTAMAFHHAGFRVCVANVDPRNLMLSADAVAPLVTADTAAIVAVHLYGQRCPALAALRRLCDTRGIVLIEDCAHRLDLLDEAPPLADYACYSFNAVKEVPCGEGGLLWGRDGADETAARAVSNVGLGIDTMQRSAALRHADYLFTHESGLKLRLNDLAASLVNGGLESLAASRSRRAEQFALYDDLLAPLAPRVQPLPRVRGDACLMYVARVPAAQRDRIRTHLAENGVASSVHYPSLARHPLFRDSASPSMSPDIDATLITLPSFPEMTPEEQRSVADALATACERAAASPRTGRHAFG
ncbi:MAG: DegT/DnrJ/EryC1/StrS aminotransferase family protein [Proteobacteria bacterium]|nr:DegT/DnrJ/EryC1/StrS aminotransferase family protein [Pseudomonadota bacterium]